MLDAWGIGRQRDETTGDVVHSIAAVLVHAGGAEGTRVDGAVGGLRSLLSGS